MSGTRYCEKTQMFKTIRKWEEEDRENEVSRKKRSEIEFSKLMISIKSNLKFTIEVEVGNIKIIAFNLHRQFFSEFILKSII